MTDTWHEWAHTTPGKYYDGYCALVELNQFFTFAFCRYVHNDGNSYFETLRGKKKKRMKYYGDPDVYRYMLIYDDKDDVTIV